MISMQPISRRDVSAILPMLGQRLSTIVMIVNSSNQSRRFNHVPERLLQSIINIALPDVATGSSIQ